MREKSTTISRLTREWTEHIGSRKQAAKVVKECFEAGESCAVAELYRLKAVNAQLVEALEPFAAFAEGIGKIGGLAWARKNMPDGELYGCDWDGKMHKITQADILNARAALNAAKV